MSQIFQTSLEYLSLNSISLEDQKCSCPCLTFTEQFSTKYILWVSTVLFKNYLILEALYLNFYSNNLNPLNFCLFIACTVGAYIRSQWKLVEQKLAHHSAASDNSEHISQSQ